MEKEVLLGCSFVIRTLGWEVGHKFSIESIRIYHQVTTVSEVWAIISLGTKTHGDPLRKCLIFFHMTKSGASPSNLDDLFPIGLAGNLRHHVYAKLPAVSGHCIPWRCVFSAILSGRMCLKSLLIIVESDRHGVGPQHTSPLEWIVSKKAVSFLLHIQLTTDQRVPISSWEAEYRSQRGYMSQQMFSKSSLGISTAGLIFVFKVWHAYGTKKKMKQYTVKSKSPSAHWTIPQFPSPEATTVTNFFMCASRQDLRT